VIYTLDYILFCITLEMLEDELEES